MENTFPVSSNMALVPLPVQYTVVTVCIALVGYLILKLLQGSKLRLPPGPRGLPVIGHLHMLGKAPHQSLMLLAAKHGKIFRLKMGVFPTVVISSPDLAREVLKVQDQHLASRPTFESGKIMAYDNQSTSLTPLNDRWRFMRRIISTELVSAKRLEQSKSIRREELLDTLEDILTGGRAGVPVDFDAKLTALVLNQTTRFNFRRRYYGTKRTDVAEGAEAFQDLVKAIGGTSFFFPAEFFPFLKFLDLGGVETRLRELAHAADLFYSSILASHRNEDGTYIYREPFDRDFVDVLCTYQKESPNEITDQVIKAAIQDVIIASSSTSSATMIWVLAELMKQPQILREVQKELDTVVGKERLVDETDIANLPYLRAVLKEAFRLHPVLPLLIPHQSEVDVQIGGYDIPAKTRVMVNTYAIGRDPEVWKDPLDFNPGRFLGSAIDVKGQNFELLPFGAGRRMCVGYNLGLMTVENGLAQILHTCDISLPEGMTPKDVSMEEQSGASVTRADTLKLRVTPRLPAHVYVKAGINL
uniref:Cytochrome P450-3 n=1 Tax=Plagiochasma appendiculatum TaxID=157224 RepID=A0A2R3U980_9MARC|nr:cytochrome P450-3 [Plagiochasma appendiculatum]